MASQRDPALLRMSISLNIAFSRIVASSCFFMPLPSGDISRRSLERKEKDVYFSSGPVVR
jgi:hypothetical protein